MRDYRLYLKDIVVAMVNVTRNTQHATRRRSL